MTERVRAEARMGRRCRLLSCLALGCRRGGDRPPSAGAGGLTEGPTRWLMLPDECHQADRLRTSREAVDFVEKFWQRRDPDPEQPGNEFSKTFYQRVEAADHLYGEGGVRGSLTDRGRALDPPRSAADPALQPAALSHLRAGQAERAAGHPVAQLVLEIWVYPVSGLPPDLVQRLGETICRKRSPSPSASAPAAPS